ncbi:hypothetical protein [Paludisphaera soli]|uniref:hypothetical protein n=1 Tax=Paludisphaera soli TaxID=2712865 RepID=UPI0013EC3BC5|nr:hypothetical protein [Paludisphaera soli]
MAVRILHCGKSLENYATCMRERVFGFTHRGPEIGDDVYLVMKRGKDTLCGMRARLADVTDSKPWPDADKYVICFTLNDVEYSSPFDIRFLSQVGGEYWALKYLQQAKPIKETEAVGRLARIFDQHRIIEPDYLGADKPLLPDEPDDDQESSVPVQAVPDAGLSVLGTFQTVRFKNETDASQGLEPLVNRHFYSLFPAYREGHSILIAENRLFRSAGVEARGDAFVKGIRSIPDAILVVYNRQQKHPLAVNLIEYECFGESKISSQEKSNHLNCHVIPQLMRFASAFSIVTDKRLRDQTIKDWVDRIVSHVYERPDLALKLSAWIKEIEPAVSDQLVGLRIHNHLTNAFQSAMRVVLVVDELSGDQKDTIGNVISAFKLESGESIQFLAYIVRLHQKIQITDENAEYALSVQ